LLFTLVPITPSKSIYLVRDISWYASGFFSAYSGPIVHQDVDYVVHLGDYLYEKGTGGAGIGRTPSKMAEIASLDDYRRRYDQYRTDIDLSAMHQQYPIIAIWDDHE
jgi:alkaline phosphatase D